MLLLLQKMDLLLTKTPQHDIKAHILPMIYRALESQNQVIQVGLSDCGVCVHMGVFVFL